MTVYDNVLLQCLNCFLNSKKYYSDIDGDNAEMLLKRAEEHKLLPILLLTAGEKLKETVSPQKFARLNTKVVISVSSQVQRTAELVRICNMLRENGIEYAVCKGAALRALYADSDYRISSDEDLLIEPDFLKRAEDIIISAGYEVMSDKDKEVKLVNLKNKMLIELHTSLVGNEKREWKEIDSLFSVQSDNLTTIETGAGAVKTFKPDCGLLSLFVHLYNHFVIGGVGIRQVMDIACYIKYYKDELDLNFVLSELEKVNAAKFAKAVIGICSEYFGVECDCGSADEELLEDFLCAGIYGDADEGRRHSGALTKKLSQGEKGIIASAFSAVFPSDDEIVSAHPELKGNKTDIIAYRFKRIMNFAGEKGKLKSVSYTGKRSKLLKRLGILK